MRGPRGSLEKLFGRTRRIVRILFGHWTTVERVPRITTRRPRQLVTERGEQIVNCPSDDRVVVHSDVNVNQANRVANSCKSTPKDVKCNLMRMQLLVFI